ncbi:hypothetical protein [uncultured Alistipes sp.]|uniref:hypothetical protein n=1 Tax=uncultured Alistipes sp. TaxID=538949 RepID=UPI00261A23D1|nr:hypothetical protein [uncultured Alistipes sp.]
MKKIQSTFGGGSKTYLRPELFTTEVAVENGFAASETFPGGEAKPFDAWGDQLSDAYGDPIEE